MELSSKMKETWTQKGETATLEEHQAALYALLLEFDRVARALGTPYFIFAGTLLGAVRHQGFIPWDDDLDVLMLREDYERFMKEAPPLVGEKFFLQPEFSEHFPMFFSKLRINGTTCLEKHYPKDKETHQGVYIDIFPCDNACKTKLGRIFQFCCSKVIIAKGLDARGYSNDKGLKKPFMRLCRLLPMAPFRRIVERRGKQSPWLHSFLGGASRFGRNVYRREWFEGAEMVTFCGGQYPAPIKYHEVLTTMYDDYTTLPSREERSVKSHNVLVDLKHDYTDYLDVQEGMKWDVHIRSIR